MCTELRTHIAETGETKKALTDLAGLKDLWVRGYEMDEEEVIWFCKNVNEVAICPRCQQISGEVHERQIRMKRDLSVFGKRSYLEYEHRRFKCVECKRPFTEIVNGIPEGGRYTERYEKYIYDHYKESSIAHIAREEELGYKAASGIFYREAEKRLNGLETRQIKRLGVDEISMLKGRKKFALILSDLDRNCVVDVIEERHKEKLEAWLDKLSGPQKAAIQEVSMDMWSPYRLAVQSKLPDSIIVADRFHVMQNLNKVVTKTRREIQRDASDEIKKQLKGSRWLLVKNQEDLSDDEQASLDSLYKLSPELKDLHLLKESFRSIFESQLDYDDALWEIGDWCEQALESGYSKIEAFVRTLENWADEVTNYFHHRTTQGFVEGVNNKIKLIMRRGYGYRNFRHFVLRILTECGAPT
ncbi:MAG: ISL3 family transposase [Bacteroidota bacterium]